jgi:hypothetical protein
VLPAVLRRRQGAILGLSIRAAEHGLFVCDRGIEFSGHAGHRLRRGRADFRVGRGLLDRNISWVRIERCNSSRPLRVRIASAYMV